MTGLASAAIYLASSLTTAQAPGANPSALAAGTVAAAPILDVAVPPPSASSVGLLRSRDGKSLNEVIADEVRRDARPHPAGDEATGWLDDAGSGDDADLSGDVMAAHDARIGFIKGRMEELRLQGASAAPMLDRLRIRLKLAMAARRLAVAREAIGQLPSGCATIDADACDPAEIPAARAVTAIAAADPRAGRTRPHRPAERAHHAGSAGTLVASARPAATGVAASRTGKRLSDEGGRRVADSGGGAHHRMPGRSSRDVVRSAGPATHELAARGIARRGPVDSVAAGHSDRARRSLAAARRLLQLDAGGSHPGPEPASLLHWEGSDTWSLADYPRSAA